MQFRTKAGALNAAIFSVLVSGSSVFAGGDGKRQQTGMTTAAPAPWTPRVESRETDPLAVLKMGELVVNGQVVLRLRTAQGGIDPIRRAEIAAERLRAAIALGLKPSDVIADTTTDKANPRLKALGQVIATASPEEAKGALASPGGLVQNWVEALRKALAVPGLSVDDAGLVVPLNESRVVRVGGAARGPVTALTGSGDAKTVIVTVDPDSGDVTLTGNAPGREMVTLTREGATATITVSVQPYAGRFEVPRPVTVTGASTPPELIARHALAAALAAARPNSGATAQVTAGAVNVSALLSGQAQSVEVPVAMTGEDMISVTRTIRVSVANQALPPAPTSTLFYSNNPERILGFGTLFVGRLAQTTGATRLLYHHQSAMGRAALFTVELINDRGVPAQVQIVGSDAGPVRDTVWVGFRAASDFVRSFLTDTGAVVEIPPHSRIALTATRLAPGLTISGLMQLRPLSGPPPLVRVAADIPGGDQSVTDTLLALPSLWSSSDESATPVAQPYTLSEHVYPEPTKKVQAQYSVGGRWAFLSIGREPIKAAEGVQKLAGNYGVFYDIEVAVDNPTAREQKVRVVFEPSAGLAGGIFLIDGKTIEIPQTNLPTETTLARYTLAPGAKQTIQIKTLPLSGSNYPATLVVRP